MTQGEHFRTDHLTVGLRDRAVRGIAITVGAQFFKFVVGLGSTMIFARLLSPADYGLLAMVAVITGFVAILRDGGLSVATIQRAHITEEQISTLFWINTTLGFLLTLFIIAISPLVSWFFRNPALTWVTVAMAFPFLFSGLTVQHQALLQRQMRFAVIVRIEILSLIFSVLCGLAAAAAGWGYWTLVVMPNVFSLSMCVLTLLSVRWLPGRASRNAGIRSMLKFGGVLTLNDLFNSFGGSADKMLLGKLYQASVVGLYTRAQTLMLQPLTQFMPAVQNVVLPVLSRLAERPERMKRVFLDLMRLTAYGCSFVAVYLVVTSDWLVWAFLGPKWIEAGEILRLLAGPAFVIPLNALCVLSLTVQNKSVSLMRWGVINNALNIVAVVIGVHWGPEGVASALTIVALVLLTPFLIYLTGRAGPATPGEIRNAIQPAVATCVVGCVVLSLARGALALPNAKLGLPILLGLNCAYHASLMLALPSGRRAIAGLGEIGTSLRMTRATPAL